MTRDDINRLTQDKLNSPRTADRLVADELLEMGFSYNHTGAHYLHDSMVLSTRLKLENFTSVNEFCLKIAKIVCKKYRIRLDHYSTEIAAAIERAFSFGNINYLLETFKGSYDYDKMKVTKNAFIMTVRKKIVEALELQQSYNVTQLRLIIQNTVENITDIKLLQALYDIVVSVENSSII